MPVPNDANSPRTPGNDAIRALDDEIARLDRDLDSADQRLQELADALLRAEPEREALTRELGRHGGATQAQLTDLISERESHARELEKAESGLIGLVSDAGLPFALAGAALRGRVEDRLLREAALEVWQNTRSQGAGRTAAVLGAVDDGLPAIRPPLLPEQAEAVKAAVSAALDRLWFPAPENAAGEFRHEHARGPMNQRLRDRLDSAGRLSRATVLDLVETAEREGRALRDLGARIAAAEAAAPNNDELANQLRELNRQIDTWREEKGQKENYAASRKPELEQKRKELARHSAVQGNAARPARLAERADEVAEMLDALIEESRTQQAEAIASAMTEAIRAMAHRSDLLNRVEINRELDVLLLTTDGRDLREFDLSAGEKQVFTQALFAAVAQISCRVFPLVIDTPLGRLDEAHRVNVLRFLASREGQVILISTDTEVVGQYLDAIRPRIAGSWLLRNTTDGSIGHSAPVAGYFPGQGL
jgi:DNA sulfur modification protein DndD